MDILGQVLFEFVICLPFEMYVQKTRVTKTGQKTNKVSFVVDWLFAFK